MDRLVCYSLLQSDVNPPQDLVRQLVASVSSLRAYNRAVAVRVFTYGNVPGLYSTLAPYEVVIQEQGSYQHRLAEWFPCAAQVLQHYPVLHRVLNFPDIERLAPLQVLLLDCDTVFFRDVDLLFARYSKADCYAREEPSSKRSHLGYDPNYLDEDMLHQIAIAEGIATPPPFNTGVVLLNRAVWRRVKVELFLSYVWRLLVWMSLNPAPRGTLYVEGPAIRYLRQGFQQFVTKKDVQRALHFPSANRWIVEEVAFWLTLGNIAELTYDDFATRHVIQNGEFAAKILKNREWIVCHYYSIPMNEIAEWMRQCAANNSPSPLDL